MRLFGKNAIVTGSARGIGRAIAIGYAREGANVAVVDIEPEGAAKTVAAIRELGRNAVAFITDVTDEKQVNKMIADVKDMFGKIDILVNNAGCFEQSDMLATTVEQWDRVMNANLRSVFLCTKAVAHVMKEQQYGKIINMGSTAGERGRVRQQAYSAAKAGVETFTMSAALQLGQFHISVNAITPGVIETENPEIITEDEELMAYRLRRLPFGRLGLPEEIVGPAVFLASSDSSYMTGQTLIVDGGLTARLDSCGEDN